jgi:hypothetical protein
MKSVTTRKIKNVIAKEEIILLPFSSTEEDFEQLQKEYEEDRMLAYSNGSAAVLEEIKMLNSISYNNLSRVA